MFLRTTGVNFFLLSASKYVSPFWLTIRQANELGGHVREGEESTVVVFWKVDNAKQSTEDLDNEGTDGKTRRRFLLRYYRVFNLEQCELPQTLPKIEARKHDPIETAERIIADMPNRPEIQYTGSKAFYSSLTDPLRCRRANCSLAPRNFMRPLCMRRSIMPSLELCRVVL